MDNLGKTGVSRGIVGLVLNLRSLGGGRVARLGRNPICNSNGIAYRRSYPSLVPTGPN